MSVSTVYSYITFLVANEANIASLPQMYVGQGPLELDSQPLGPTETYINKKQYVQNFSCQNNRNVQIKWESAFNQRLVQLVLI